METIQTTINLIDAVLFNGSRKVKPSEINAELFRIVRKNAVANVIAAGIKKQGLQIPEELQKRFSIEMQNAELLYAAQAQQIELLCEKLEQKQIPFVLLKGARIRDFYPSPELRTSGDIDILTKADDETLHSLMQELGFTYDKDGGTTLNFRYGKIVEVELHRRLFDDGVSFHGYFDSIWDRVQRKPGWSYQYKMTEEDFYANMIAHFAKHFSRYGCGIRNALDVCLYLRNKPSDFSSEKADAILKELGLLAFERELRQLDSVWFGDGQMQQKDEDLTDYLLGCGTFGNHRSKIAHKMSGEKKSKFRLFWNHLFPSVAVMRGLYPVLDRCILLLPFCWVARWVRLLFKDRKKVKKTIREYSDVNDNYTSQTQDILHRMHLDEI